MPTLHPRAALVAATLALVACETPSRPMTPESPAPVVAADAHYADASSLETRLQHLYADPKSAEAVRALSLYRAAAVAKEPGEACARTLDLVANLLDAYRTGALRKTLDPATDLLPAVQSVIHDVSSAHCPSFLGGRSFPIGALSWDGAAVVVRAAAGGSVATGNRYAAADFPGEALVSDAIVTISRRATPTARDAEAVLATSLGSGPFYDFATFPSQGTFRRPVTVGIVQVGPHEAAKNIDVVLGHRGPGSSTPDVRDLTRCPLNLLHYAGQIRVPAYLRPASAVTTWPPASSADVAADGVGEITPVMPAFDRDSSGTTVGCGTASGFSPFGFIEVHRPGLNAKGILSARAVGCRQFTISNRSNAQDIVAIWRAISGDDKRVGQEVPVPVFVRRGASVPVVVPAGTAELRLSYGPVQVETVRASACP